METGLKNSYAEHTVRRENLHVCLSARPWRCQCTVDEALSCFASRDGAKHSRKDSPRHNHTHTHQGPVKYHVRERRPLPSGNKKRNMTVINPPPVEIRIVYPLGSAALGPVGMAYQNGPSRITRKGGVPMIPTGPPAPTRLNART